MIPRSTLDHLTLREGRRSFVYADSLGNLTGGVGHLLTPEETRYYPEGAAIPNAQIQGWLSEDSEEAWAAAVYQSIDIDCPMLVEGLFHVCFQLGPFWHKTHKKTWALLQAGEWEEAAVEAADSLWYKQTPVRV